MKGVPVTRYGEIAQRAVAGLRRHTSDPAEVWQAESARQFPDSPTSRDKVCPREAFLGLIDAGVLLGKHLSPEQPDPVRVNRVYAVTAWRMLQAKHELANASKTELWQQVLSELKLPLNKKHNSQMDVVLSVWAALPD